MAEQVDTEMDLATSAHAVLMAWEHGDLAEAVRNLGGALADWLQVHDLRQCDGCGKITNAGDSPDWINGECEECDPSLLDPCNCQLGDAAVDAE